MLHCSIVKALFWALSPIESAAFVLNAVLYHLHNYVAHAFLDLIMSSQSATRARFVCFLFRCSTFYRGRYVRRLDADHRHARAAEPSADVTG